jgi:AcrR family transcriptional regulator
MPTRTGRRSRRIERRRKEILRAAARVFAAKGYASATTREIAEAADVAEGTLYNYFDGKRAILLAIASDMELPMEELLASARQIRDREDIVRLFEQAMDVAEAQMPFARAVYSEASFDDAILQDFVVVYFKRVHHGLCSFISDRIAGGIFRPVDPALAARLVMGMLGSILLPVLRGLEPLPSPDERRVMAEAVIDLLLDGIRVRSLAPEAAGGQGTL